MVYHDFNDVLVFHHDFSMVYHDFGWFYLHFTIVLPSFLLDTSAFFREH